MVLTHVWLIIKIGLWKKLLHVIKISCVIGFAACALWVTITGYLAA